MAALTITAASVIPSGTYSKTIVIVGEAVTPGQQVYLKTADSKYWLSQADGTAEEAATAGICLGSGAANQLVVILTGGPLTIGAAVVKGTFYYTSPTAGGIGPFSDLGSTNYVTQVGQATSTTVIFVAFNPTGIQI